MRGALDGLAARLAAGRADRDAAGRAAFRHALDAGQAITASTPIFTLVALDESFHQALYSLSGNPTFAEIVAPHWPYL